MCQAHIYIISWIGHKKRKDGLMLFSFFGKRTHKWWATHKDWIMYSLSLFKNFNRNTSRNACTLFLLRNYLEKTSPSLVGAHTRSLDSRLLFVSSYFFSYCGNRKSNSLMFGHPMQVQEFGCFFIYFIIWN